MFGKKHTSADHAYQMIKAIRAGNLESDEIEVKTTKDAKRIGHTISHPLGWRKS